MLAGSEIFSLEMSKTEALTQAAEPEVAGGFCLPFLGVERTRTKGGHRVFGSLFGA